MSAETLWWPFKPPGGKGDKRARIPPPSLPAPVPTPQDIDIEAQRKGEDLRRKLRARRGRAGTILTESTLGTTAKLSPILGTVGEGE